MAVCPHLENNEGGCSDGSTAAAATMRLFAKQICSVNM